MEGGEHKNKEGGTTTKPLDFRLDMGVPSPTYLKSFPTRLRSAAAFF